MINGKIINYNFLLYIYIYYLNFLNKNYSKKWNLIYQIKVITQIIIIQYQIQIIFFSNFDFSEIEAKDPSLSEDHKLIYNREVPFELRLDDNDVPKEIASFEAMRCKILIGGEKNNPIQIRIELSCENDLFFSFYNWYWWRNL